MAKKLSVMDASWLMVESKETPMHVANLATFTVPEHAPAEFMHLLVRRARAAKNVASPWNLKLKGGILGKLAPAWVEDHDVDIDYHFRHLALPHPGGERQLGQLVSQIHSQQLDLTRPPWECYIIEGLENNRVALYVKMHHSLIDGVSGARMLQRIFSNDPLARDIPAFWTVKPNSGSGGRKGKPEGSPLEIAWQQLQMQAGSMGTALKALRKLVKRSGNSDDALVGPFAGPVSVLNKRVRQARRFATQQYDLGEIKALAKKSGGSLNDIVLYLCATSMRRFLKEANLLPKQSLTAGIPVNIRAADDQGTGNAISFIMAKLGTDVADPLMRLNTIIDSAKEAKDHLQAMPKAALTQYTMAVMAPYMLELISGLGGRTRPVFNVTISNVPGPDHALYYNGAKLEAMYPVSLIAHGGALNITCLSYNGTLNFGFTGCRDTLPHMQRLAVYMGEALDELKTLLNP
jgi:WS/DGAT/MGAT family acyltransferase